MLVKDNYLDTKAEEAAKSTVREGYEDRKTIF